MLRATNVLSKAGRLLGRRFVGTNIASVEQLKNDLNNNRGIHVVKFYAEWCKPCEQLNKMLEGVVEPIKDKITISNVDIDKHDELAAELEIYVIPATLVYKDGVLQEKFTGLRVDGLKSTLENLLQE